MASREDVVTITGLVAAAYPWATITAATIDIWAEILQDVDGVLAVAATKLLIGEAGQWPPSVGMIRQRAFDLAAGPEADWEAGWQAAMRHMTECHGIGAGMCEHDQSQVFDAPTYAAVSAIGWRTLCLTELDNMPTVRAQFRDIYRTAAKRQRDADRMPPAVAQIVSAARPRIEAAPAARIAALDAPATQQPEIRGVPGDIGAILDAGGRLRRAEFDAVVRRIGAQRGGAL